MEPNNPKTNIGFLPSPTGLVISNTKTLGKLNLKWKKVLKNSGYLVQWTQDLENPVWPGYTESEKTSASVSGLNPGERYFFRVATLSHAGYDGYTAPVAIWILNQ
ncbi:MAG: fibronectin type III domain-containing protein [Bacteroidetes bacterium]|nr:fibronectin type III domain-containing protein [Bacteroidota bacterium]